ncbi:MAG: sulfatase-like hydrolase/transferase [Armatimonadota bacterium]
MPQQPNILFIFSDQQRWDTLGCYGQPLKVTPNLDAMAAEGVRFEHAFTCQPVCGPARACLQTGKYATETGCFRNNIALPLDEKTLAHQLSTIGYEVGYLGKWHLASDSEHNFRGQGVPPERRGGYTDFWLASDVLEFTSHSYDGHMFDADGNAREFPEGRYRVDAHTDWAIEYLRSRDGRRPFFLFLSYIEPHFQNDHAHFEGPIGSKERYRDFVVPGDLEGTEGDWRAEYPDYLGCCASLDENVGRLREELTRLGMADNTLVIYTSDHGCHFKTRNSEYKRSCHEGSIRIPMLASGPGFTGGRVVSDLVSLIDLPPTVLAAGGAQVPSSMRGRPLQALVSGDAQEWPGEIFVQISEDHIGRAVRTARWKYSVWVPNDQSWSGRDNPDSPVYYEQCLYDLHADPHERNNLVAHPDCADVRRDMAALLKRRMVEIGEREPEIRPAIG